MKIDKGFTPYLWKNKKSYSKNMIGKNERTDLMYLRSGDKNFAIGVNTNLNVSFYANGAYIIYVYQNEELISTERFIKN